MWPKPKGMYMRRMFTPVIDAYLQAPARNFLPQHDWRGDALLLVDADSATRSGLH